MALLRCAARRLTGLGFNIKVTGKFDDETRSVIRRWQAAQALAQGLAFRFVASVERGDEEPESHASHPRSGGRGGGGRRYYRSSGGGGGAGLAS